jgi:hypothetical protein
MRIKLTEYQIGCELWMLGYFNNPPEMFDPNLDHVVTINGQLLARTVHANARLGCVAYEFNGRIVVSWGRVLVIPTKTYRAAWPNSRAKSPLAIEALQARVADQSAQLTRHTNLIDQLQEERCKLAAELAAARAQEPVSYRYKFTHPISGEPVWRDSSPTWNGQCVQEVQPLFAAPVPPVREPLTDNINEIRLVSRSNFFRPWHTRSRSSHQLCKGSSKPLSRSSQLLTTARSHLKRGERMGTRAG